MRLRKLSKPFSDNVTVYYAASVTCMNSHNTLIVFNNKLVFLLKISLLEKALIQMCSPKSTELIRR
jgi:hypothetical protein